MNYGDMFDDKFIPIYNHVAGHKNVWKGEGMDPGVVHLCIGSKRPVSYHLVPSDKIMPGHFRLFYLSYNAQVIRRVI